MFKKELYSHLLVAFLYFLSITLFNLRLGWRLFFLWFGGLLGTFLLDVDHFLLCLDPKIKTWWAQKFRYLLNQKRYRQAILCLGETHLEHRTLVFHSALFQPILLILAFFVLTSTGSLLGTGLVMSINLHLLKDEWQCFFEENRLDWLFWQIKRKVSQKGQLIYLLAATFLFLLLTRMLL